MGSENFRGDAGVHLGPHLEKKRDWWEGKVKREGADVPRVCVMGEGGDGIHLTWVPTSLLSHCYGFEVSSLIPSSFKCRTFGGIY